MSNNLFSSPLAQYHRLIAESKLEFNHQQEEVLIYLTEIWKQLRKREKLSHALLGKWRIKYQASIPGLYLWGGVGIGKTLIMDCFYQSLPITKLRLHFHAFMQRLHQQLRETQGQVNPLITIGKNLIQQYSVICFDEFLVENIADAMLLTELFKTLFTGGVCLVMTSNLPPHRLYENGLQRESFLPTIDLIQQHTRVMHLKLMQDYRRNFCSLDDTYFSPLSIEAEWAMEKIMQHLSMGQSLSEQPLMLFNRMIVVKQRAERVIWFEFSVICGRPRSQQDYLALAQRYPVVLISHVPCLERVSMDLLVSFIHLVDVFYDAGAQLVISAEKPISQLYPHGKARQVFQRTESRLIEMQSKEYRMKNKTLFFFENLADTKTD